MTGRDVFRFFVSMSVIYILDGVLFAAFGLPLDSAEESLLLAIAYTLLCAIRDSDRDREADETRSGSVPEGDRARAEGIAQPSQPSSPPSSSRIP